MKILKIIALAAGVLVLAVVVFVLVVFANLDRAARVGIEQGGTYAMGVDTTLDSADLGVFSGRFAMSGLRVANPQGFNTPHFLTLGDGAVKLNYESLSSDTITLPTLTLTGIDVYLDKEEGSSNYQTILDNLKRFESGDKTEPEPQGDVAKQNVVIQSLEIRDITVHADAVGNQPVDVEIDAITLTNVGSQGGDALQLAGVFGVVTKAVMLAAVQAGAGAIPDALIGELQTNLAGLESLSDLGIGVSAEIDGAVQDLSGLAENLSEGVIQSADQIGKQLEEGAQDVGKTIDEAGKSLEDAAKGIGGILGGNKKKNEDDSEEDPG